MADEHFTQSPELSYLNLGGPVLSFKDDLNRGGSLYVLPVRDRRIKSQELAETGERT